VRRDEELLDIAQAAALLQVSETSLRRWTNAGRLACFRVGGRRERRFQRAELLAFLEAHSTTGGGAPSDRAAQSVSIGGIPVVHGSHLCGLYASDRARAQQGVDFLADGLGPGSVCFLVTTPDVRDRILALLDRRRPALQGDIDAERLVLSEYAESAAAQLEFWDTRFAAVTRAGARSLRVVADVSGGRLGLRSTFLELLEYEADYDRSIARRFPVVTLCQYDVRALSGVEAARVLQGHGDTLRYPVDRLVG
jgi:excisionase family DNA binding protein